MEVLRILLLALALVAVVFVPVLIALAIGIDGVVDRLTGGRRRQRQERRLVARLDEAADAEAIAGRIDLEAFDRTDRRPLEQIAADLRCLRRDRVGGSRSVLWHSEVLDAYDHRLSLACRALGISEHLAELTGLDRQIERVRIEAELDAAGLRLPVNRPEQPERNR